MCSCCFPMQDEEHDEVVALDMDVESDDGVLDEIGSDHSESEGEDAETGTVLAMHETSTEADEETGLRVADIDSFWLQRQLNELVQNPERAQSLAEEVLAALSAEEVSVARGAESSARARPGWWSWWGWSTPS